ncbi:Zn-ribbon domain-containing OB-fold protein [Oceanibacterium hippocampi]|uniref:Uncharacterized protein n=1 Tax=Oceanibacterium hippocampi TaxID=745714 RepID=A0A1Y5TXX6_9PROT|nr:OB-fold domain-containing protein [Oceanibacterium hippocampi]SLN71120.1 hypothetical protein OCH7691_03343 [Oceanibacterium hippocampi]
MTSMASSSRHACPGDKLIPIRPDLFTEPDACGRVRMLASRCRDCGEHMFPVRMRCVSCYGADLEKVPLDRFGKVESFTVVRQAPPGYAGGVPYVLGTVVLGNHVRILTHLIGKPDADWKAGDRVASCATVLPVNAGVHGEVLSYAFRDPATDDDSTSKGSV